MKQFLYLDTSKTTSYLAQVDGGSLVRKQLSASDAKEESVIEPSQKVTVTFEIGAEGDVKILKGLLSGGLELSESGIETAFMQTESAVEMAEYVAHDDIFNNMLDHVVTNNLLSPELSVGKYVIVNDTFKYQDLAWTLNFVEEFDSWKAIWDTNDNQIDPTVLNRNQRRQLERNKQTSGTWKPNSDIATQDSLPCGTKELVNLFSKVLPSTTYLHSDRLIAFLKKEYLRENTASMLMKSKKPLTLMGFTMSEHVTVDPENADFFSNPSSIPYMVITMLENLHVNIYDGLKIIEPIAIYHDESDF